MLKKKLYYDFILFYPHRSDHVSLTEGYPQRDVITSELGNAPQCKNPKLSQFNLFLVVFTLFLGKKISIIYLT